VNHRIDSTQIIAAVGASGGFVLANFDRIAAALCALAGLGYTLWKWRREAAGKGRNRHG
jgi:hypothetical protein